MNASFQEMFAGEKDDVTEGDVLALSIDGILIALANPTQEVRIFGVRRLAAAFEFFPDNPPKIPHD